MAHRPGHVRGVVQHAYAEELDRTHRSLLNAWLAFLVTFGLLRALTYGIREDLLPWGDVEVGAVHLHHYLWGILLLLVVGLVSLVVDSPRYNPLLGLLYGVAAALVLDEYALLLQLEDVYWAQEGRVSVDVVLWCGALLGAWLTAASFWSRVGRELLHRRRQRPRPQRSGADERSSTTARTTR